MLQAKEKDSFFYQDSYNRVTDLELETLLKQSQEIVISLKAELDKRQIVAKPQSPGVIECSEKL